MAIEITNQDQTNAKLGTKKATPSRDGFLRLNVFTWHRAIFSGGYPPNIVAAAAFHNRVRDGSEWDHSAMDTRIETFPRVEP